MNTTLRAFHGSQEIKDKYLTRVREHRIADQLVQGTGWSGSKGCAVGCTLHAYDHSLYPTELGIPVVLARLEDGIFEGLSVKESLEWPEKFLSSIRPGADLEMVWPRFSHWMLADPENGMIRFAKSKRSQDAINDVALLYARWIDGVKPAVKEWRATYVAADACATYVAAAAYAADANAVYAAAYAADANAAYAAAYAAVYAAVYADANAAVYADANAAVKSSRSRQAAKLLELLAAAPVAN